MQLARRWSGGVRVLVLEETWLFTRSQPSLPFGPVNYACCSSSQKLAQAMEPSYQHGWLTSCKLLQKRYTLCLLGRGKGVLLFLFHDSGSTGMITMTAVVITREHISLERWCTRRRSSNIFNVDSVCSTFVDIFSTFWYAAM